MAPAPSSRSREGILGIDEAGRGSVLGPLVVGGFLLEEDRLPELGPLGVRDSKQLTPGRRVALDRALREIGRAFVRPLPPGRIDRSVRHGELNALEAETFGRIVRAARAERAFVDACDVDEARFGRTVARHAGVPSGRVVARPHADAEIPVVAAASIIAKVARDRAVGSLARSLGHAIGTGYPSDPETRAYLVDLLRGGGSLPDHVRASWATVRNLMPAPRAPRLESFR